MKVSIHFSRRPDPAHLHNEVVLDGLDLHTALTLSAALTSIEGRDVDSIIVLDASPRDTGGLRRQSVSRARRGWLQKWMRPGSNPSASPLVG